MFLLQNGVPFDVAFGWDDVMRAAACIVASELNGKIFNWSLMKFTEP